MALQSRVNEVLILLPNGETIIRYLTTEQLDVYLAGSKEERYEVHTENWKLVFGKYGPPNDYLNRIEAQFNWTRGNSFPKVCCGVGLFVSKKDDGQFEAADLKWIKLAIFYSKRSTQTTRYE